MEKVIRSRSVSGSQLEPILLLIEKISFCDRKIKRDEEDITKQQEQKKLIVAVLCPPSLHYVTEHEKRSMRYPF